MAQPISELFVKLGFQVDKQQFANAEKAIANVEGAFKRFSTKATEGLKSVSAGFAKSFNGQTSNSINGVSSALSGLAQIFAVYKLGQSFKDLALGLDKIDATAEKLGISTTALQELQFAAQRSDTDIESLNAGLLFLGRNVSDGGSAAAKALASIGIAARAADGSVKPLDSLLSEVAGKFADLGPGQEAKKLNLAQAIFGRSGGAELIGLLNKGTDGIEKLRERAQALGYVASEDLVKAGAAFDDAWTEAGAGLSGIFKKLAGPLIKPVTKILEAFLKALTKPENQTTLKKIGAAFEVVADAIVYLSEKLLSSENLFGRVAAVIAAGGLLYLITSLGTAFTALAGAMSPVLIPLAALALILDDIFVYLDGGDSILGRFLKTIDNFDTGGSKILEFFKTLAQLIFDVTDTAKWEKLFNLILAPFDFLLSKIEKLVSLFPGGKYLIQGQLGSDLAGALQSSPNFGALANPNSAFVGGASSPSAAAALSSSAKGSKLSANTTINVSVGPGAEPNDIAQAVKDAIRQENERIFGDANASLVGGY